MSNAAELFRNNLISDVKLTSEKDFKKTKFSFSTESSDGNKAIKLNFTHKDFVRVADPEAAEHLIKTVAFIAMKKESKEKQKEFSL